MVIEKKSRENDEIKKNNATRKINLTHNVHQRRRTVQKSEGAISNVVGIICHPGWNRVN